MAKKIQQITMMVKQDAQGNLTVRFVGKADDGTHPFGEETQLTNGDKNSLKAVINKIIAKLEK